MLVRYNNIAHSSAFDLLNTFRLFGDFDKSNSAHRNDTIDDEGIKIELPGVKASDVDVSIDGQILRVTGKSRHGIEFNYSYTLKSTVDEMTVSAKLVDGLLAISLPKKNVPATRKITIVT